MKAILCPGQGSQTPGFLSNWTHIPIFTKQMEEFSEWSELDLLDIGTTADAETLKKTTVAQPLIVASGLSCIAALREKRPDLKQFVFAGHSVGEIVALSAAGALTFQQAIHFTCARACAMEAAADTALSGMSAVIGGQWEDVENKLSDLDLAIANVNGKNQIVAAGTRDQLSLLHASPPMGATVIQLEVAAAFHTSFMKQAADELDRRTRSRSVHTPRYPVVSSMDGAIVFDKDEISRRLIQQLTNPVRWDLSMKRLSILGVTSLVELTPAGVLTGLAKRNLPGVRRVSIKNASDILKI